MAVTTTTPSSLPSSQHHVYYANKTSSRGHDSLVLVPSHRRRLQESSSNVISKAYERVCRYASELFTDKGLKTRIPSVTCKWKCAGGTAGKVIETVYGSIEDAADYLEEKGVLSEEARECVSTMGSIGKCTKDKGKELLEDFVRDPTKPIRNNIPPGVKDIFGLRRNLLDDDDCKVPILPKCKATDDGMAVGDLIDEISPISVNTLETLGDLCVCLDDLLVFLDKKRKDVADSVDQEVNEAVYTAIKATVDLVDCFEKELSDAEPCKDESKPGSWVEASYIEEDPNSDGTCIGVHSNEEEVIACEEVKADARGDILIRGAPIDRKRAEKISLAIVSCFIPPTAGACADTVIASLKDYFKDTVNAMKSDLIDWLRSYYQEPYRIIQQSIGNVEQSIDNLNATIRQSCDENVDQTISDAYATVKEKMALVEKILEDTSDLPDKIEEAIDSFEVVVGALDKSYQEHMNDLVVAAATNETPELWDAVNFIATELKPTIESTKFNIKVMQRAEIHLQEIEDALNKTRTAVKECVDETSEAGLKVIKDVEALGLVVEIVRNSLNSFVSDVGSIKEIQPGAFSYQTWMTIQLQNLPCVSVEDWKGFFGSISFNTIEDKIAGCSFEFKVQLPNEHIPYLRIVTDRPRDSQSGDDSDCINEGGIINQSDPPGDEKTSCKCEYRWSGWSKCTLRNPEDCDSGVQTRKFHVMHEPVGGGLKCPHEDGQIFERPCSSCA
eukprot:CAMPEP_0198712278 /NCGR_PEP_ID=MMETSP1471-20131121/4139_1 /TAXON_ID=41880 /ORGANISM="Pycnococcus provasolii, Strain RCC733" /LENGTH=726 /DNA_ID=CAMNT_0044472231 /DNA_START=276 /DNA_END=2456 /DNA_ORIENTATION=-